ncbi:aspartate aminotransferase [Cnuella takakiae]|uniref:Aminotransferase n=1 Tax=Cnuella takakiae TaxID=1302690 RepID=A0A1M4Y3R1_9BACT|nr:pyridoxal phosphate-dependent aminotransferase [Cnuella takakiae]OLY93032.1 aspartate aminotransferase [Cnuella takakiae]SHF00122.1 aspartate aminotransferase [Cnuella takakiae]
MVLASRLQRFNEPETLKMAKLGRELRAQGHDVIDLSVGEPDFDVPDHIQEAAKKAIDDNWSHYTPVAGYPDLREAVCTKLKRDNNLDYKAENIVVSTGAKQSLANIIMALVDEGDEVVIPTPYWVTYAALVQLCQGKVVEIKTDLECGYKITPAQLEAAITPRTKVFMFSSPCNPSGAVYSTEELEGLAEVFRKYPNIAIISDEIYEYITYGQKPVSIASLEGMKDRTIIVNGLSKGFAMTGWRIGYIAAPVAIAKACEKIQGQVTSGTNSVAQRAAIIALTAPLDASEAMVKEFAVRRKRIVELLLQIDGVALAEPDGAFYAFPRVDKFFGKKAEDGSVISNSDDLCMYLLNTAHVSTVTGSAFGNPECIRLSFANSLGNIEKAVGRIKEALAKLN